jgi:hypothetical protein
MSRLAILVFACVGCAVGNTEHRASRMYVVEGCYQFDRAYFRWVGLHPAGGKVTIDSARVIRLDSTAHRRRGTWLPENARVVAVPSMLVDTMSTSRWLSTSYWRATSPDGIELQWYNGLFGPAFRLVVARDSLKGQVSFQTDVAGTEPPPESAFAVRVACSE